MEVAVWTVELDVPEADVERLAGLLHEEERERGARFAFGHLRRRYVVAHAMVRSVLRLAPDVVIEVGPHGKPSIVGGPHFNLSHSGERALLAVCDGAAVGVDVEAVRPLGQLQGLADRIMSADELAAFTDLAPEDRAAFFFDLWTWKEAVVKASGDGIIRELRTLSYEGYTMARLEVADGYAAALAVEGSWPDVQVRMTEWRPLPARWPPGGEGAGSAGQARPADI